MRNHGKSDISMITGAAGKWPSFKDTDKFWLKKLVF